MKIGSKIPQRILNINNYRWQTIPSNPRVPTFLNLYKF